MVEIPLSVMEEWYSINSTHIKCWILKKTSGNRDVFTTQGLHQYSRVPDIEVFDHYFRHLYRIFKFVNESPLIETEEERYDYACIVRSQLSEYELLMLFYNSLQEENVKFKTLIEKFAVFNNIRMEKLASRDNVQLYDEGAFCHR